MRRLSSLVLPKKAATVQTIVPNLAACSRSINTTSPYRENYGPIGRSSNSGITATVFGCNGFLGSYMMSELGACGSTVYAPFRGCELEVRHLKPMFDLGNLGLYPYSIRDETSCKKSLHRSNVVINMVGKFHETKHIVPTRRSTGELSRVNFSYEDMNVTFPRQLARAAKQAGVETFIHVSSLSASPDSASAFSRSKFRGELAVLEEFPNAIIIRPGTLFGPEDRFLNPIAKAIVQFEKFFLLNNGRNLMQPTYVADVTEAIMQVIRRNEEFKGKTLHLAGPAEYSYKEIVEFVADIINVNVDLYDTPPQLALLAGHIYNQLPFPSFTADTMARISEDTYIKESEASKLLTFANLGMEPSSMDRVAFNYLYAYRPGGHFTETSGYH